MRERVPNIGFQGTITWMPGMWLLVPGGAGIVGAPLPCVVLDHGHDMTGGEPVP